MWQWLSVLLALEVIVFAAVVIHFLRHRSLTSNSSGATTPFLPPFLTPSSPHPRHHRSVTSNVVVLGENGRITAADEATIVPKTWQDRVFGHWECMKEKRLSSVPDDHQVLVGLYMRWKTKYYCLDSLFQYTYTFISDPWQRAQREFQLLHSIADNTNHGLGGTEQNMAVPTTLPGYLANTQTTRNPVCRELSKFPGAHPQDLLSSLHFIGIIERFDESLVVLRRLLGLSWVDILYYDDSSSESLLHHDLRQKVCVMAHPARPEDSEQVFVPMDQVDVAVVAQWKHRHNRDWQLWELANQLLDATIDAMGRQDIEQDLARFRSLREDVVDKKCPRRVVYACTVQGERAAVESTCLQDTNVGCADRCIGRLGWEEDVLEESDVYTHDLANKIQARKDELVEEKQEKARQQKEADERKNAVAKKEKQH